MAGVPGDLTLMRLAAAERRLDDLAKSLAALTAQVIRHRSILGDWRDEPPKVHFSPGSAPAAPLAASSVHRPSS